MKIIKSHLIFITALFVTVAVVMLIWCCSSFYKQNFE